MRDLCTKCGQEVGPLKRAWDAIRMDVVLYRQCSCITANWLYVTSEEKSDAIDRYAAANQLNPTDMLIKMIEESREVSDMIYSQFRLTEEDQKQLIDMFNELLFGAPK